MLARMVAVLTGLALLGCSWWMVDRNNAEPEGEVALDLVVAPPASYADTVNTIYMSGGNDPKDIASSQVGGGAGSVTLIRGPTCANLPEIGRSLDPAPQWVVVAWRGSSSACLLSGRWRLADLVGQVDDSLSVTDFEGRRRVDFTPPIDDLTLYSVLDFDLRVRLPADVESVAGGASVTGNTVHWDGTEGLWSGSGLSASSRVIPLPQEVAPWLVGTLALLMIGLGALWPQRPALPAAADPGGDTETIGSAPAPSVVTVVPESPVRPNGPDPDNPWRPPS